MRAKIAAGLLVVLAGVACVYASSVFVFNPFTYRANLVTNLPWSWYRGPLQIEYGVFEAGGWRFSRATNTSEARALFRELARSSIGNIGEEVPPTAGGRTVWIGVRRTRDGAVLLDAKGREGHGTFLLRGQVAVSVTPALLELLSSRLPGAGQ